MVIALWMMVCTVAGYPQRLRNDFIQIDEAFTLERRPHFSIEAT